MAHLNGPIKKGFILKMVYGKNGFLWYGINNMVGIRGIHF